MRARVDKDGSSFKMSLKATIILAVVVAVIFMFAGGWIRGAITKFFNPQQELTNEVVVKQLEKIQDLTTAKETDYGFEKYEDGGIAFLNKKQFTMFYTYEVRAGGRSGQGPDKKSTRTPKQCLSRYLHRKSSRWPSIPIHCVSLTSLIPSLTQRM